MAEILEEVRILLQGLALSLQRSPDVDKLPTARPELQRDAAVFGIFSVCLFAMTWAIRLFLIEPGIRTLTPIRAKKVCKSAQSATEALSYGAFSIIGVLVVPSISWSWPSERWWAGYTQGSWELMRNDLRCYWLLYAARYAQLTVSLFLDVKRTDFSKMLTHHVTTLGLISISYFGGWNRVGSVIMFVMDPADVPLHLAKICKYMSEARRGSAFWSFLTNRLFEIFGLTFFVTRILMYNYILWSLHVEGPVHVPDYGGLPGKMGIALLHVLQVLQVYWGALITRVVINMLLGKEVDDVRSDEEGSPEKKAAPARVKTKKKGAKAEAPETPQRSLWIVKAVVGLTLAAFAAREAWLTYGALDATLADVRALLGSLVTTQTGSAAEVAALPVAPPDLERDRRAAGVFAAAIFATNWGMRMAFVEPFARMRAQLRGPQVVKFAQSFMEASLYGGFAILGLLVVPAQEFVWPSSRWWMGFAEGGHEKMRLDLRCYYLLYIARYFQALVSVLLEIKRKDFPEMVLHHVVTIVVIYISYVYGWNRVGVVVMVLLDPADVPLHIAKMCKYVAEASGRHGWQFMADRFFEVFALIFFITRCVLFSYVCWSAHIEATRYFPKGLPEWTCVVLLYTLLVLQGYWFSLILKVAAKMLKGSNVEDIRSDDEAEVNSVKKTK